MRSWPVWALPRNLLLLVLTVEFVALATTVGSAARLSVGSRDWLVFGVLAAGSVVHLELVRRTERARETMRGSAPYVDLKSLWTFAAVLVLPPLLAVALVVLTFVHLACRVVRRPLFRWVYNTATVVLATHAAGAVLFTGLPLGGYPGVPESWNGVLVVILAGMARVFVNYALIAAVIVLSSPQTGASTLRASFADNMVDCAGVSLGGVTALAAAHDPWYVVLVIPPLLVLHRSLLVHHYEVAARTDEKTGLANAMHWSEVARRELSRAQRDDTAVGILMIDLDHFKGVNDTYGHLAGDAVLKAVADAMRRESRDYDLPGRFGGEEFVLLLPGTEPAELVAIADRLRARIAELVVPTRNNEGERVTITGRTASIGAVGYPSGGHQLDELLLAADSALYKAKETGRNRTCLAPAATVGLIPEARKPAMP